jgi:hypothetical protein
MPSRNELPERLGRNRVSISVTEYPFDLADTSDELNWEGIRYIFNFF